LFSGVWCMGSVVGTLQEAGNHKTQSTGII